jgi:hypothetical protein
MIVGSGGQYFYKLNEQASYITKQFTGINDQFDFVIGVAFSFVAAAVVVVVVYHCSQEG